MKGLESPYACAVCPESFTNAEALVKHVKTKHESIKIDETNITEQIKPYIENSSKETEANIQENST